MRRTVVATAIAASLVPTALVLLLGRPVGAATPAPYDDFSLTALVAGARTAGDVGAAGGLVTLESGSAWVQATLDAAPSSFVRAAPYEPGPLVRTVVGQVNDAAGQTVLEVPDAEAAFPGVPRDDLGSVPESGAGPLVVSGGTATARASDQAASGTSTGAALSLSGLVVVDGSTSAVELAGDKAKGTATATARTAVARVTVAGVLELRDVVATAAVSAAGATHTAQAHLSIGTVSVAGQEIGFTDDGLVAAKTPILPGTTIAQATDAANAALTAAGVSIQVTAAIRHTGPHEAAADTGGLRITVATPDLPGGVAANRLDLVLGGASLTETDQPATPTTGNDEPPTAGPVSVGQPPTTTTTVIPGTPGTSGAVPPSVAPAVEASYQVLGRRFGAMAALAAFGIWQFLTLGSMTLYSLVDRRRRLALLEAEA
ncbi:MAG: hypothetical protein JWN31_1992 [Frankiales bacterium]|nr:hypothetical protein [Frankiales bacterium]